MRFSERLMNSEQRKGPGCLTAPGADFSPSTIDQVERSRPGWYYTYPPVRTRSEYQRAIKSFSAAFISARFLVW